MIYQLAARCLYYTINKRSIPKIKTILLRVCTESFLVIKCTRIETQPTMYNHNIDTKTGLSGGLSGFVLKVGKGWLQAGSATGDLE